MCVTGWQTVYKHIQTHTHTHPYFEQQQLVVHTSAEPAERHSVLAIFAMLEDATFVCLCVIYFYPSTDRVKVEKRATLTCRKQSKAVFLCHGRNL